VTPEAQLKQLRQLLPLAGAASPPPAQQPTTSAAAAANDSSSSDAAELPAGYPLATTLRCFVRLLQWQHAARLALIQQLAAAGVSCCCQLMPAGMSSRALTCSACRETPALAVVLPPAGAVGTAEWAAAVAARRASGSSSSSKAAVNNKSSSTPTGRSCGGGTPSRASQAAAAAAAGASSPKRLNSPGSKLAAAAAAAAAATDAVELPLCNGAAVDEAAGDSTDGSTPSCKRSKLRKDYPESAAAAAAADGAAVDAATAADDASGGSDSSSGSKRQQEKPRRAAAAGPLCLTCGLHAAACAGQQQQLRSWEGCVVMVARNMQELEALAR
jgi:hypothetical protein